MPSSNIDEFWMYFDDFMLVFSNLFVVLDLPSPEKYQRFNFSHRWTEQTCGGTPIPIKQPVFGTAESWTRNPQFQIEVLDAPGSTSVSSSSD